MTKLKFILPLIVLAYGCGVFAESGQPILIGYGRDAKWSPGEKFISYIRGDALLVRAFPPSEPERVIMRGSVFEYEWLDDSTLAVHERRYVDSPGGKDQVHRIKTATLDGLITEVAADSFKMFTEPGKGLRLFRRADGQVVVAGGTNGAPKRYLLSAGKEPRLADSTGDSDLYVRAIPGAWGKIWLFYRNDSLGRQITTGEETYLLPKLSATRDKILCLDSRSYLIVFDTLGNRLVDLGIASMPQWDQTGQYIVWAVTVESHYDIESSHLWTSRFDGFGKQRLVNSSDAVEGRPFFSPSGDWLMYTDLKTGRLFVVSLRGGNHYEIR